MHCNDPGWAFDSKPWGISTNNVESNSTAKASFFISLSIR